MLAVHAGNLLFKREQLKPEQVPEAEMTADLILRAGKILSYHAVNVGAYDLSLGVDYLLQKERELGTPFLSANLVDRHGKHLFHPYLLTQVGGRRVGILGLVDADLKTDKVPEGHKLAAQDPFQVAATLVPEMQREGAEWIVVLTDMEGGSLRKLALSGLPIDLVVGSDKRNHLSLPITVKSTFITHLDRGGKAAGRLDVDPLPPGAPGTEARGRELGDSVYLNAFVPLLIEMDDHPAVGSMVYETKAKLAALQRDLAHTREGEGTACGTEYVGAAVCKGCHPQRYTAWAGTAHARAYQTLVERNREFDEECVVCHALAYECGEGTVSAKNMEAFAHVQCESCHGAGDLHALSKGNQAMGPKITIRRCLRCHTEGKSSSSDTAGRFREICSGSDDRHAPALH